MASKRIKINFETINEGKFEPVDMKKVYEDQKKMEAEDLERYKSEVKKEEKRIKEMTCPSCKSKEKNHYVNRESNGIFGPGRASWLVEEYYICMKCGIHYSDLNKKEISKPYKGFF
jgi:transposase-like protein